MIYRIKSVYKATDEPTISYCDIEAKDEYEAAYLFYQNHGFKYEVLSVAEVVNGKVKSGDAIVYCRDCIYAHMTNDDKCEYCDIHFPDKAKYYEGSYYCASGRKSDDG